MSSEKKTGYNLATISLELTALARDLAQGKLRVGSRRIDVCEPLFFKTKQKVSGEKAYFTLSFQVPLAQGETGDCQEEKSFPIDSKGPGSKPSAAGSEFQDRPPEAKKIKKQITALWKAIGKSIDGEKAPPAAEEKKILAFCEDYNLFAESAWQAEWRNCVEILRKSLLAAKDGDFTRARELADEVNQLTKSCHKKYK
ncbi:hypothetical protein ACUUL3_07250 [Thiovibrio sp. JS02]